MRKSSGEGRRNKTRERETCVATEQRPLVRYHLRGCGGGEQSARRGNRGDCSMRRGGDVGQRRHRLRSSTRRCGGSGRGGGRGGGDGESERTGSCLRVLGMVRVGVRVPPVRRVLLGVHGGGGRDRLHAAGRGGDSRRGNHCRGRHTGVQRGRPQREHQHSTLQCNKRESTCKSHTHRHTPSQTRDTRPHSSATQEWNTQHLIRAKGNMHIREEK